MDPDRHGDADAWPGMVDFAVNVRPGPPDFVLAALSESLLDLAAYPRAEDEFAARASVAESHGRSPDEVLLLNGVAEGFELLAGLSVRHAAVVVPSFTEPVSALRRAGVRVTEVVGAQPWRLAQVHDDVPSDADLVVVGNPTNPTSVLHPVDDVLAFRAPGRLLVVDEAFADLAGGSVADRSLDDVVVLRSVTKTFGLAGLRAGYLLAAPGVIADLTRRRRSWPVGSPTLAALRACTGPRGQAYAAAMADEVAGDRDHLCRRLVEAGFTLPVRPEAPFVLAHHRQAATIREQLARRGFAVRSAANFTGLSDRYLRFAVRGREVVDDLSRALEAVLADESRMSGSKEESGG
ncbi:putative aminotransferase [Gordonia araii NBRC 100433]|uniref:Aminotransferase n=1 Tax=Gordonia araii NBRC 100433 TaxID=1073574 RepID=G7GZI7_9ACTN|nr:Rv2231c family pyridoxal phosphate-dependent protein CobC [Gordonia araii]NNG97918.1 threonine-phosphate decarboxylase [Gordonia araii NBRC 100433]GAB09012.1 putative aminotransferase [Gordonia araii NBRC 100433]